VVGLNNNLHLTISCLELPYGFHTSFEMSILILMRGDYLQDIDINGRNDMHLERRVLECVDCIHIALSRDQRWDVLSLLIKPTCHKCG